ncbi:MAG: hypothetical protein VX593_00370 [Pseudomonadota bacterium]|nr:hypothetical protein [Pseudomonadota bacterium]
MRRLRPKRQPRTLERLAILIGLLFVTLGVAALIADPDAAHGSRQTGVYVRALQGLRDAFGDPGGGLAMIGLGVVLGGVLFWAAGRKS